MTGADGRAEEFWPPTALESAVRQEFADINIYFTNDVEVGWAGSMAIEPGINVVSGTGSIAFGKDDSGKSVRCGGWSEFFSDEGSCYWMGRKVLELFSKQADGRIEKDALYDIVCQAFGLQSDMDIIDIVHDKYMPSREQVAGLQILAKEAALAGSPSVVKLYQEAVSELCMLIDAVYNQLDFAKQFLVSYTGGLFKAGEFVLPQFSREIERMGGRLIAPRLKPEEGAILLACQRFLPGALGDIINACKGD